MSELLELTTKADLSHCYFCGARLNADSPFVYQAQIGWARRREQGGLNALALRQSMQVFACAACIDKERRGLNALQEGMPL